MAAGIGGEVGADLLHELLPVPLCKVPIFPVAGVAVYEAGAASFWGFGKELLVGREAERAEGYDTVFTGFGFGAGDKIVFVAVFNQG